MTRSTGTRPYQLHHTQPTDPALTPIAQWFGPNRGCYAGFRDWLQQSSYSPSALNTYGVAARLALSLLDKPYWQIDPDSDLAQVQRHIEARFKGTSTPGEYHTGLLKFGQYLRLRCQRAQPEPQLHWETYVGPLPSELADQVRAYWVYRRRNWPPDRQAELAMDMLSQLTRSLRWLVAQQLVTSVLDLTPQVWCAYVDARLAEGLHPIALNSQLSAVLGWMHWLDEQGQPVCARIFKVDRLTDGPRLPKDVPPEQLRLLAGAIHTASGLLHAGLRRMGLMDHAWFLLMLHSGLRTGEVRRLRLTDLDWERRLARIEQSKGLKDRLVPLSTETLTALKAYLAVRGPADALPAQVFIFRHAPLNESYCGQRLSKYYAPRCGVRITPHQLRHSCATLLLNAGAPVLTVQTILGHKHVDTTLGYARLYDGTVAADYYAAMTQVEKRLNLAEKALIAPPTPGELVALVDSLRSGTLNSAQTETVRALRAGILALAEHDEGKAQGL